LFGEQSGFRKVVSLAVQAADVAAGREVFTYFSDSKTFNPLSPELNPFCYLLALLAHHFLHVSRI